MANQQQRKMDHFSHKHPLTLVEDEMMSKSEEYRSFLRCYGCTEKIGFGVPYYRCEEGCPLFCLHHDCAHLPTTIKRWHYWTGCNVDVLQLKGLPNKYYCFVCFKEWYSFAYVCSDCGNGVDMRCAMRRPNEAKHSFHQHPVYPCISPEGAEDLICSVCTLIITRWAEKHDACLYYKCNYCNFIVHPQCTNVPLAFESPSHPHKFRLDFLYDSSKICKICQEEIDWTTQWAYTCSGGCSGYYIHAANEDCLISTTRFAEEVFHGIQEEVANTSLRSHKLVARLQCIEAAIAPVEKVILAQNNHLHFAYTPGCFYHTHLENEQNHFINSELPQFIEEYYEECSIPPCLQLLDKFDTGGPGSCLKRYSDPSFFSRASASSCEANVNKLSKEKKVHGSKENMKNKQKKRTRKRNLVSHAASLSKQNDRVNIDSVEVEEHISPQTISPSDVAMKSDQDSQLNSFDSRSDSGFIECIFRSNHSTGFEEQELKESCVWNLGPSEHISLHSASVDEHSQVPDNEDDEHVELLDSGFLHSSPQDPTGPISHGVTWVEKKEIVEPTGNQYYPSGTAEISEMNIDRDIQEKEAGTVSSAKERDSSEGAAVSESSKIEPDSSTETLEIVVSDSESDTNFQMKQKMEELFNYNDIGVQEGLHMLMTHPPDIQTRMEELPVTISSECYAKEESPDTIKVSPVISNNSGLYLGGHNESSGGSFLESNASSITGPGIRQAIPTAPEDGKLIRSSSKTCGGQTVQFWTNGSLLGLEPSKPPVFGELNDDCLKSLTRSANDVVPSSKSDIFIGNSDAGKLDTVQSSESIQEYLLKSSARHIDQHPISKNTTSEVSPTKLNGKSSNYEHGLLETSKVVSQSTQAVHPDVRALPTEAIQEGGDILIPIFGNRFLNNIQREVSVAHDATSQPHSSRNNGFLEQRTRNRSDASKGCFIAGNTLNSPSSSPPLEHVKISFQPINGSEIGSANLKLKFSDGSSSDVLPSFQLIREPSPPQYSANSDSDDDTFCRSSAYLSDDSLSHQSDLNSELWESDGTPSKKEKSLSDAISRISLSESASRIREHGEPGHGNNFYIDYGLLCPKDETCLEPRQSTQWCDLPNLSTLNPLFELDANESE